MRLKNIVPGMCFLIFLFFTACYVAPTAVTPTATPLLADFETVDDGTATLDSLQKVDDFPLYTMRYAGRYASGRAYNLLPSEMPGQTLDWACSLFTVLLDEEHLLYGRNFDWRFSPALLLFTDPPDGYASVSMVDIEYLGYEGQSVFSLTELTRGERQGLLDAPYMPFDGMNEHGLAIGMAAVPGAGVSPDPGKETIGSIAVIREILDHARTVEEAIAIMDGYNIDFGGGPTIHYLIADANRESALVEFYAGEMRVIGSERPWHSATNFLRSSVDNPEDGGCWRYNRIDSRLEGSQGLLDTTAAMELLADVAQQNTQWSVVYDMSFRKASIVMGRDYKKVYTFQITDFR
jgi:hypothetical protein